MRNHSLSQSASLSQNRSNPLLVVDILLSGILCLIPNLLMLLSLLQTARTSDSPLNHSWLNQLGVSLNEGDPRSFLLWLIANLVLMITLFMLRRYALSPMVEAVKQTQYMLRTISQQVPKQASSLLDMRAVVNDLARMTHVALEYYLKHQQATHALTEAQGIVSEISRQQSTIVTSTSREMITQHQCVLAYANYLEERIARHAADPSLRYDFDEVSESSFNLKLIAGSLELMQAGMKFQSIPIDIPMLMQQTMLALAASLDRRNMKLTTVEVQQDVVALADQGVLAHVLWMMLLGTIRYAADESTLRMRCLYNRDRSRAMISIVVSELCSSLLTEEEREAFLANQLPHATPHMFAETIRIHANIQLAEMLTGLFDGELQILPLTTHSCEICLSLPAGT